ncbi:MAG TPA: adenylate kinase [Phaeodactylibacter sp.]|nr:adenylate kinase [Phaeodactylibacter sp.]
MINLILFGPPGSGKGTQAAHLVEAFQLLHISTGDLFRYEIGNSTELGLLAKSYMNKGELVPDEVTIGMLKNKVNANPDVAGYIFDGFPRTVAQAEALDLFLKEKEQMVTALLALDVPEDELVSRLLKRGETSGRADDKDETVIRKRIAVYEDETAPVFEYYQKRGVAKKINGLGSIDEITARLVTEVKNLI